MRRWMRQGALRHRTSAWTPTIAAAPGPLMVSAARIPPSCTRPAASRAPCRESGPAADRGWPELERPGASSGAEGSLRSWLGLGLGLGLASRPKAEPACFRRRSCFQCESAACSNDDSACEAWAAAGECASNERFMLATCPHACRICFVNQTAACRRPADAVAAAVPGTLEP